MIFQHYIHVFQSTDRLTIPLLWEDPFSLPTKNYNRNFIEIYLYSLNDDEFKEKYKIHNNNLPSNTLFNYPSFIKYFHNDYLTLHSCILVNRL